MPYMSLTNNALLKINVKKLTEFTPFFRKMLMLLLLIGVEVVTHGSIGELSQIRE